MSTLLTVHSESIAPPGLLETLRDLDAYIAALWSYLVSAIISTACMGMFTALTFFSTIVLVKRGLQNRPVVILLLAMYTMYFSTALYWITLVMNAVGYYFIVAAYASQTNCHCIDASIGALSIPPPNGTCPSSTYGLPGVLRGLTLCVPTILLTINVIVGDAIVWWRAWVIWPNSALVHTTCVIFLTTTLSMGVVDSVDSCPSLAFAELSWDTINYVPPGSLYENDLFGLSASVLSLATNLLATILIGCKAWEHRKFIEHTSLKRSSSVERVLVLLVESGAIYCVLWVLVVVYQVASQVSSEPSFPPAGVKVLSDFKYFMNGCIIPFVGMYPTSIILLVALNKSPFGNSCLGDATNPVTMSSISFHHRTTSMESAPAVSDSSSSRTLPGTVRGAG